MSVGRIGAVDVAIAIDASSSTRFPSDADIDGDGETGGFTQGAMTDPADSLLAVQVAAVRSLVRVAAPAGARFSILKYSGRTRYPMMEPPQALVSPVQAVIRSELTADPAALEDGLERVLEGGSRGGSDFSAAMRSALRTLVEAPPELPETRRFILFLSDSPDPVLPEIRPRVRFPHRDPMMKTAAIRAIEAGVRIHAFALGNAAGAEVPNALTHIAGATGGTYHVVEDPNRLHCHLLAALVGGEAPTVGESEPRPEPLQDPAIRQGH